MKNIGTTDKAIRLGVFAILVAVGIFTPGTTRFILWGISLIPLVTAIFGFCPLYPALGINTAKK